MTGRQLFDLLISAANLPGDALAVELEKILKLSGKSVDSLTLDEVREVLASYLQDVLVATKDSLRPKI